MTETKLGKAPKAPGASDPSSLGSASQLGVFLCFLFCVFLCNHWPVSLPSNGECWAGRSSGYAPGVENSQMFQKAPEISSFPAAFLSAGPSLLVSLRASTRLFTAKQRAALVSRAGLDGFNRGCQTATSDSDTELVALAAPFVLPAVPSGGPAPAEPCRAGGQ